MIAIDTNVVIRFLTRDDESQFRKSRILFKKHPVFIPDTVVLESEWVLRYAYEYQRDAICDAFEALFGLPNVELAEPELLAQAIEWHRKGVDFADAMHLAKSQSIDKLYTFDRKFVNSAKKLGKCKVTLP